MADPVTISKTLSGSQAAGQIARSSGSPGAPSALAPSRAASTGAGHIYRPRMIMFLSLPYENAAAIASSGAIGATVTGAAGAFAGLAAATATTGSEVIRFPVRVQSARITVNDHNHADEAVVTCDWHDAGIDPRIIGRAIAEIYIDNSDDDGNWEQTEDNLVFIGRVSKSKRHGGENKPMAVELTMLDYTSFFTTAKPFAAKGFPKYEQTIEQAWDQIIYGFDDPAFGDNPVANLADALDFRGLSAPGPKLADAAVSRYARLGGQIQVDPKIDAWAIWQQCCGICGLVSYFERDRVVVTTALDLYTGTRTPHFIWGKNILSFNEERNNDFERKGVGISSFNPLTGKTIEAVWPPVGDKRIKGVQTTPTKPKKKAAGGHGGGHKKTPLTKGDLASREHRDYFQFSGITNPEALEALAKRVWEERSRQEMQSTITTSEMSIEATDGSMVDLLKLHSGDTVSIKIDDADWAGSSVLESMPDEEERAAWFQVRGYSEGVARLLARNLQEIVDTRHEFYVKTVNIDFSASEDGGNFSLSLGVCNKIEARGDTAPIS